jgi:23S rRNA (uracil1939-C5)-methyltransferase
MRSADVTIDSIAGGGDGVARAEGLVIFVPRSAPGDSGTVRFTQRGRFARGALVALRAPSPARVEPPCPHYRRDNCGGCQLQHLRYDAQLAAKAHIIRDALERIGRREVSPPDVQPSPAEWRYRRKLTLALRRQGGAWIGGLHPYDRPAAVFPLRECPITEDGVMAVWREVLHAADDLPQAEELRGAVQLTDTGAAFVLQGGHEWTRSAEFFARVPAVESLWWEADRRSRVLLHARGQAPAPGASFAQVNTAAATLLRDHVLARVMAHAPAAVVDAYAGMGDLAVALAERGVRVTAIERDPDASAWSASRLPAGSRALPAAVEDALPGALPADVIVLNPPRVGVDASVALALESTREPPRAVIYVSCNPATLARDLARMPRYRIASLAAFDMFPQTAHVETVCELHPEAT